MIKLSKNFKCPKTFKTMFALIPGFDNTARRYMMDGQASSLVRVTRKEDKTDKSE